MNSFTFEYKKWDHCDLNVVCVVSAGFSVVHERSSHRCFVGYLGQKKFSVADSVFHLCPYTTHEDQPMVRAACVCV